MAKKKNECPYLTPCPFFKTLTLPTSAEIFKVQYCKSEYKRCKRYALQTSGKIVPEKMWPDGTMPG